MLDIDNIRNIACIYYIRNEVAEIIKNAVKAKVSIPEAIVNVIKRGGNKNG